MADCDFDINVSVSATGQIQFKVPNVTHPCVVRFRVNGSSTSSGNPIGDINIVQMSGDRITLSAPEGTRIEVEGIMECPLTEVANNPDYKACGPTTKSVTHTVGGDITTPTDIVKELLKTLGLPLTLPFWLLWLLFFVLAKFFKMLGADWPDPDEIKRQLKEIGKLLPKWLRILLDID